MGEADMSLFFTFAVINTFLNETLQEDILLT